MRSVAPGQFVIVLGAPYVDGDRDKRALGERLHDCPRISPPDAVSFVHRLGVVAVILVAF
jgi:hypothetical protein